ncbi:MAG: DNA mismatch repair protein MutL, partial [Candidatus Anoxychlamydiales bacterium]|nr:DNA mismatch repair protein MutL [Candidatus Anoxychlamydiales bacterium]
MAKTINFLDDLTINKIAAGEVIENPLSVIKELVENSIDAKAKNIVVDIKNSGYQSIRVEDDGNGMSNEDAKICFFRHSTSKIKNIEDLENLSSMGFRGEALSSIASISRVDVKTSQNELGIFLKLDRCKIIYEENIARNQGTTIEVKNLFFNVPVRKKFQKSISYTQAMINKLMINLALANPNISFTYISNDKKIFKTNENENFKQTIEEVLSSEFLDSTIEINYTNEPIKISGFIGYPLACKKNRSMQYLFINKRIVYSAAISKFIKDAYFTMISEDEYPIFVLNVYMPSNFLDVNVHPQKKEVRIKEELFIKDTIKKAVTLAFEKKIEKPQINSSLFDENNFSQNNFFEEKLILKKENVFKKFEDKQIFENKNFSKIEFENFLLKDHFLFIDPKYFSHILENKDSSLLIIDLKALLSRYLFEKIKNEDVKSQTLLVPINIKIDQIFEVIEENLENFLEFGFDISLISDSNLLINSHPSFLKEDEILHFFNILIEDIKYLG